MKQNNYQNLNGVIKTVDQLNGAIMLSHAEMYRIAKIIEEHPMAVTPHYLNLIATDDPNDPIKKMVVPSAAEMSFEGSFDTSGEKENTKIRGLQHKYAQTALVLVTNGCAVYCRHCFRKRLVGVGDEEIAQDWPAIINYLRGHEEINNVLLSGGDPLTVTIEELDAILGKLVRIPHLNHIRIGSRIPVVQPSRISDQDKLVEVLERYSLEKRIYIITQFNHPLEIAQESVQAIERLQGAGLVVSNQAVLLKGVNDDAAVLAELMTSLTRIGVVPYYLFQCRPVSRVKGAFQVPLADACDIVDEVKARLDGLSKRFRFVMSHRTGKIEILGREGGRMFFKYHQAKDPGLLNRIFSRQINPDEGWLYCEDEDYKGQLPCQD